MTKYRIITKYPCYDGCMPVTGYFVQVYKPTFFGGKWQDVRGLIREKEQKNC
jgi:hypothetical protein